MKFIGIIPARYASSRFPGKPLAMIAGKSMIQRVYEQVSKALDTVVVATDDDRIFNAVRAFSGNVVMTSADHRSGTDRCREAYEIWNKEQFEKNQNYQPADVIINIQGDEPFIQPEQIKAIKSCFPADIATLVMPYSTSDHLSDLLNPNNVKAVVSSVTGNALCFSRSVVPYLRGVKQEEWLQKHQYYKHIGMYAYRAEILQKITALPQSKLEIAESLEQMRWLENGYTIKVAVSHTQSIGIDIPEDLQQAEEYLRTLC